MWMPNTSLQLDGNNVTRSRGPWSVGLDDFAPQFTRLEDAARKASHRRSLGSLQLGSAVSLQQKAGTSKTKSKISVSERVQFLYLGCDAASDGTYDHLSSALESVATPSVVLSSAAEEDRYALHQRELSALKTGEDAIRYFARHGSNSKVKVLHCNRCLPDSQGKNGPYSLTVTPEDQVEPEHFTISQNGVLHVCPGQMSECTPLSTWMQHSLTYDMLISMPFVKHYCKRKNFAAWSANVRYEMFCRRRQQLSRTCWFAKPPFAAHFAKAVELASAVKSVQVLEVSRNCSSLEDFAELQYAANSNRGGARGMLEEKYEAFSNVIHGAIRSARQSIENVSVLEREARCTTKAKPIYLEKLEAREFARRRHAAMADSNALGNFIRLVDYMLRSALVEVAIDSAKKLRSRLDVPQPLFTVSPHFNAEGAFLDPPLDRFIATFRRIWDTALRTVDSVPRLLADASFNNYVGNIKAQCVGDILLECQSFVPQTICIADKVSADVEAASMLAADYYAPYHCIFQYGSKWSEEEFRQQAHSVESLSSQMSLMVNYAAELEKFPLQRTVGLISLHGSELREELARIPDHALAVMKSLMAGLARDKCAEACQRTIAAMKALEDSAGDDISSPHGRSSRRGSRQSRRANIKHSASLTEDPLPGEGIDVYATVVSSVEEQVALIENLIEEVDIAYRVLARHNVRVSGDEYFQREVLQSKWKDLLDVNLPEAKAYLDELQSNAMAIVQASPGLDESSTDWYSEQFTAIHLCSEPAAASCCADEAFTFPAGLSDDPPH
jgi:hypothetical protein